MEGGRGAITSTETGKQVKFTPGPPVCKRKTNNQTNKHKSRICIHVVCFYNLHHLSLLETSLVLSSSHIQAVFNITLSCHILDVLLFFHSHRHSLWPQFLWTSAASCLTAPPTWESSSPSSVSWLEWSSETFDLITPWR